MNKWLNTTVTLKCWLVFLVGFVLAGYTVEYAIFLGALGGLMGGFIASWWKVKEATDVDVEQWIDSMKKVKKQIEGRLGLRDDKSTKKSKNPRMGFFSIRDPNRSRRR